MTETSILVLIRKDGTVSMTPIIPTLEEEFRARLEATAHSVHRRERFPDTDLIKVVVGMRRSGKTYFLLQTARELVRDGVPLDRILYINFEDDRILPLDHKGMGQLIDGWYSLHPGHHDQTCYLLLDEVQNVEEWALVLRRLIDTKKVQIYVTGSSAKLLSKEIATSLRGRSLSLEMLPYSYVEYLEAHQLQLPSSPLGQRQLDLQRAQFLEYFHIGGFPGVQSIDPTERIEVLQGYVETVIFRDIVERHQVRDVALLKYLIKVLLKNSGAPFSISKFGKDIKSQGYSVGRDTLYTYLSYLEDAFLVFTVPIFTESLRQAQTTPKKIYAIDNGLVGANTFSVSECLGKQFENQVYLDLRRQGKQVYYHHTSEGYEVDFVTQDRLGQWELLQVVWDATDPQTLEREERALRRAQEELGIPGKLLDLPTYLGEWTRSQRTKGRPREDPIGVQHISLS